MTRLIKALKGLSLALLNIRVIDLGTFQSKRIAIVGPASSAFNTGKGSYIDGERYPPENKMNTGNYCNL